MEETLGKYVYHGSAEPIDIVQPRLNKRMMWKDGKYIKIFEDISFHATPYRWIALAYTRDKNQKILVNGEEFYYTMAVDLYKEYKVVEILGINSLEESLSKLYGKGGYVYVFEQEQFSRVDGLGNLEVITKESATPVLIEEIVNPVQEMIDNGVEFKFSDLADPEHFDWMKKITS